MPCRFPPPAIYPPTARSCSRRQAPSKKSSRERVAQLTALATGFDAGSATTEQRRDYALARLRIVFGKAFVVLPRFTAANADELEKALADSAKAAGRRSVRCQSPGSSGWRACATAQLGSMPRSIIPKRLTPAKNSI